VGAGNSITNLIESFGDVDMTLETKGIWRRVPKVVVKEEMAAKVSIFRRSGSMRMALHLLLAVLATSFHAEVKAASFDCEKAKSAMEKMICADAELSKLDEEMADVYKAALLDEERSQSIQQNQKQWLKERNSCIDASCVNLSYTTRLNELSLAQEKSFSKSNRKPRFSVTQGKGWTVCESYAKFLNSLPESEPLPLCHLKLSPDFPDLKEPDWEELDIPTHFELVYTLEKLTSPGYHDRPVDTFDHWKAIFQQQVNTGEASPRLRRVRLALIDGGPVETILGYEPDRNKCDKKVRKNGYAFDGALTRLFIWDEQEQKINEYKSHTTFPFLPQELLLFHGKLFAFSPVWGDGFLPDRSRALGYIQVNHLKHIPGDADPYANLPRCRIGFELSPEISRRILK
jgi:uncharacterized protein